MGEIRKFIHIELSWNIIKTKRNYRLLVFILLIKKYIKSQLNFHVITCRDKHYETNNQSCAGINSRVTGGISKAIFTDTAISRGKSIETAEFDVAISKDGKRFYNELKLFELR